MAMLGDSVVFKEAELSTNTNTEVVEGPDLESGHFFEGPDLERDNNLRES